MTLANAYYGSALYHLSLWARPPAALAVAWPRAWPGDGTRGAAMAAGEFRLAGEIVRFTGPPWDGNEPLRAEFATELHRFGWLADLLAAPGNSGFYAAGEWTRGWLDQCDVWAAMAWRPDVLADRLVAWTEHFNGVARDDEFRARLLRSYARQARHLARVAAHAAPGLPRLGALRGAIVGAVALGRPARMERALARFAREVEMQVLPDGGHVERSPRAQLLALRYLIDARDALRAAQHDVPAELMAAIDRAAPLVRFFRHGDNRFALFNGANEQDADHIDLVLSRAEAKGKPPASAPYTGFQRLVAGRSLILMDAGPPAGAGLDRDAHAGTLSFEMSFGKERLIVNCGAYDGPSLDWRVTARATAAHSTLVVADTNSSEIWPAGGLGRRPIDVICERAEDQGSQWIEASHDGYEKVFGLIHARQLFLAADGDDLRGEDRLTGPAGQGFCIRFHLHPEVQVSLIQDGAAALLRLPSGAGWRLKAQGAVMSIGESIYLGNEAARKTRQIVLDGHVGTGGATVRWALKREKKPGDGDKGGGRSDDK
jgi:uncharacterized heparinase superfamily protein